MKDYKLLETQLSSLAVFRNLLIGTALSKFRAMLHALSADLNEAVSAYCDFTAALYEQGGNWSEYLLSAALEDENVYMVRLAEHGSVEPEISDSLMRELFILQKAAGITSGELQQEIGYEGPLPVWGITSVDFIKAYEERVQAVSRHGYGIYAKYHTFVLKNGEIAPVRHPDDIRISDLSGYEEERKAVLDNTLALIEGKPAANILLYGDAGTGKSSTVKAVCNYYHEKGLRLIELKKSDLHHIPDLIDTLSKNPLKFILFIDDLSFTKDDNDFSALKAVLEGSVAAKTGNIAIYATSNRRHLVKETFSDREGDEVHRGDTMQELVSLSERFGLTITFVRPGKKQFLSIVKALAKQYGITINSETLTAKADAYALRRSGYSPRVAKQFIESLKSTQD